jgi:hypothetical protein
VAILWNQIMAEIHFTFKGSCSSSTPYSI